MDDFNWAEEDGNEEATESETAKPFAFTEDEKETAKAEETLSNNIKDESVSELPKIVFDLVTANDNYRITSDDPIIAKTNFISSAEIDMLLAKTTQFRLLVFEAYQQARKKRKNIENQKASWESTVRVPYIEGQTKKPTLQQIDDYLFSEHGEQKRGFDSMLQEAAYEEARLESLYTNLNDRAYFLSRIADRFSKAHDVYVAAFE